MMVNSINKYYRVSAGRRIASKSYRSSIIFNNNSLTLTKNIIKTAILLFALQTLLSALGGLQTVFAQPVTQEWVRTYNAPYNGNDGIRGMTLDRFGNVYITGMIAGNGGIATIKYSTSGVQQWVRTGRGLTRLTSMLPSFQAVYIFINYLPLG